MSVQNLRTRLNEILSENSVPALINGGYKVVNQYVAFSDLFEKVLQFTKRVSESRLELLPEDTAISTAERFSELQKALKNIMAYSDEGDGSRARRGELITTLKSRYQDLFTFCSHWLGYFRIESAEDISALLTRVKGYVGEIEKAVAEAKLKSTSVTVGQYSGEFSKTANKHWWAAIGWLIATLIALGATGLLAFAMLEEWFPATGKMDEVAGVQKIVARILLVGVCFYVIALTSRSYRAHRHLAVVNRHRSDALATFETFAKSAPDPETKAAVLLETTRCIFAPAVTGYLAMEEENPNSRVVEIFKTATGGKGGD